MGRTVSGLHGMLDGRAAIVAVAAVALLATLLHPAAARAASTYPIESHYAAPGPSPVVTASATDSAGQAYDLFYPSGLAPCPCPLLTWGNGTNASPATYPGVLDQLASWGFIIVASTSPNTGTGAEMVNGMNYMLDQNASPTSTFSGRIDTTKIGALGHSQGAGGTVNATNHSNGLIRSDVPINLPAQKFVAAQDEFCMSCLSVPTLLLGGSADPVIASPSTLQGYYAQIPGPAAMGVLKGAGHLSIEGSGGGYLGYLTAWFQYTLRGDRYARGAFVGAPPELNINRNWIDAAEKSLP